MSTKQKVTNKKNSVEQMATVSTESTATAEIPVEHAYPPYPGFINKWEELTWGYDRILKCLDDIWADIRESPEKNTLYCVMRALEQQNLDHNAMFSRAWSWLHKPEIRKIFGIKRYDELVAENARKQAEEIGEHTIQ